MVGQIPLPEHERGPVLPVPCPAAREGAYAFSGGVSRVVSVRVTGR